VSAPQFKCGHEREQGNIKLVRNGTGEACLTCFRNLDKLYRRAKRRAA
jgi:hypothetical protein